MGKKVLWCQLKIKNFSIECLSSSGCPDGWLKHSVKNSAKFPIISWNSFSIYYPLPFPFISPGDNTPSANSYTLPSLLGSKVPNKASFAAYSMAARALTGSFSEDLAKTPGPGRYNAVAPDMYTRKGPAYSMLGRSYMPGGRYRSWYSCICLAN